MQIQCQKGYALLEVLFAVLIIAIASIGVIALFTPAKNSTDINDIATELSAIGNAFSQLSTKGLIDPNNLAQSLNQSQLLPTAYFNGNNQIVTLTNAPLTFSNTSAFGYTVNVPVSFSDQNLANQLCSKVQATYVTGNCTLTKGSISLSYPRN